MTTGRVVGGGPHMPSIIGGFLLGVALTLVVQHFMANRSESISAPADAPQATLAPARN